MKIQHPFPLCYSIFLLFLVTITLISPSLGALGKCNPSDYKALMNFKKSLSSYEFSHQLPHWIPNTDCCGWHGVGCDGETNRVNELSIHEGGVSGQIPSSVGDLPYLRSLLFGNLINITGSIPQSITKLKKLTSLEVIGTSVSGPVPNFLNQLSALTYLDLSYNQFSGSLPPNLSDLKNIRTIKLDRNKLTGSIPESFGKFTGNISVLYFSRNKLTGPIPKSLGALDIASIDFSRNKLVGDASMLFNPNHDLARLIDLSWNQLEFDLTKVKFPKYIDYLDISRNKIFGGIPEEIKDLNLNHLNVEYNRLCGKIPTGGNMHRYDSSVFSHNKCLCGSPLKSCKRK
ncbi:hypothetical protein MKX03_034202 [Papaver bracteatum]|nr:hypothetical protein MKX03_034202 [Papaver bracteatum]